jgi:tetratricopeptide (TPR) repeat protein
MKHRSILVVAIAFLLVLCHGSRAQGKDAADKEIQDLLLEVQKHLNAQKLDDAVGVLKKIVKLAPTNDGYLALLSDLERQSGKFADSIEHAQQAIKLNDKVPQYFILIAASAYNLHDLDRAREYCDKILKRGEAEVGASAFKDAKAIADMLNPQTYTITWTLDPTKGRITQPGNFLLVTVPKADLPYQTATYEVTGAQSFRVVKSEANDLMYIVPKGKQTIQLVTKVTVSPHAFKLDSAKRTEGPFPAEVRTFLGPSESIDPKSAKLAAIVAPLKGTNDAETAQNVLEWMRKNIKYRLQKSGIGELDFKTMDEIVDRGHAECRGYALLYAALCRAAGVPARTVWGLAKLPATDAKPKGDFASHNWCEVYVNGVGWVPVDPQKPESFGLQPTAHLRFYMDEKKTKSVLEILPLVNLLAMNGDSIKFD